MSLIEEVAKNMESQRAGVVAEIENTPEADLDYRIAPDAKSVRDIAQHIAEVGVGFVDEILKADGSFMNLFSPDIQAGLAAKVPRARTKAELLEVLKSTGAQNAARVREAGDRLITETMPTIIGPQTRLSALWFAVAHEMYHRGQLAIYGRGCGVVPALTQRINAMLAAR